MPTGNLNMRLGTYVMLGSLILVVMVCGSAAAKSYRITYVDIGAQLHPDGTMTATESRTYRFKGPFTFAQRDFPIGGPVTFDGFEVLEKGRPYNLSGSEEPGTYKVSRTPDQMRVTWYYLANDESRTFEVRYQAAGTVERRDDAAVVYYKFVSDEWDIPQENVHVSLVPPGPVSTDRMNEWLHGPLWAYSRITQDGTILAECEYLPANTYLEIRALYPTETFPEAPAMAGSVRDQIMLEEARWAEESNRQRELARQKIAARQARTKIGKWLIPAVSLAGLLAWWLIFKRYHKKIELPRSLDMNSEIPEKTPPALVNYLLASRQIAGRALIGTMLDLARRGFVALREERVRKKSIWGGAKLRSEYHWDLKRSYRQEHRSDLLDYEDSLLGFIFDELAGGADSISMDGMKKKQRAFTKFFAQWKKSVEEMGKKQDWFDEASIRGSYYSLALGIAMVLLTIGAAFLFAQWAVILGAAGIAIVVLSFLIPQRTARGETRARHWRAVQKYLRTHEFRTADHESLLARISDYLVYGAVLGLSPKIFEELAARIPEKAQGTYVPWYVYHGAGSAHFSPTAFGAAFSSMVATATSAMSTASGAGGGASAGGGGGASSGGGGAG